MVGSFFKVFLLQEIMARINVIKIEGNLKNLVFHLVSNERGICN